MFIVYNFLETFTLRMSLKEVRERPYSEGRFQRDLLGGNLHRNLHSKLPIFRVKSVKIYTGARDKYEVCAQWEISHDRQPSQQPVQAKLWPSKALERSWWYCSNSWHMIVTKAMSLHHLLSSSWHPQAPRRPWSWSEQSLESQWGYSPPHFVTGDFALVPRGAALPGYKIMCIIP